MAATLDLTGAVTVPVNYGPVVVIRDSWLPDDLKARIDAYSPQTEMGEIVRSCLRYLPAWAAAELLDRVSRTLIIESSLSVVIYRACDACGLPHVGQFAAPVQPWCSVPVEDHGITSRKVITDAGVAFLVDAWQNLTEMENLKYHGLGTATTAEAASQTALTTELTTQYNPNSTRATGTTTESSAPVFVSVGTNTVDASATVEEHGLFSQAATGGGTMWDRSLTGTQTLSNGDSLQTTYSMTASAGG